MYNLVRFCSFSWVMITRKSFKVVRVRRWWCCFDSCNRRKNKESCEDEEKEWAGKYWQQTIFQTKRIAKKCLRKTQKRLLATICFQLSLPGEASECTFCRMEGTSWMQVRVGMDQLNAFENMIGGPVAWGWELEMTWVMNSGFHDVKNSKSWVKRSWFVSYMRKRSNNEHVTCIAHIRYNRHNLRWCTFFMLVPFFEQIARNVGLFRPILAILLQIYALFGKLLQC